jgi:hypothetical protein
MRYAHPNEEHQVMAIRKIEELMMRKAMEEKGTAAMVN